MAKEHTTTAEKHSLSPSAEQAATEASRKRGWSASKQKDIEAETEAAIDVKKESDTEASTNAEATKESETKVKSEPKQEPKDTSTAYVKKEEEEDTKIESGCRVLEKGLAYFFYRQKVDVDHASSPEDVQRLYLLLSPDEAIGRLKTAEPSKDYSASKSSGNDDKAHHRLVIIPRKSLPKKGQKYNQVGSRNWAFVDIASPDLSVIKNSLGEYTYSTKTRGDRTQSAAQLVAEARYELVYNLDHRPHTSHFIYTLEVPAEPGPVQEAFNIEKVGQFMIQVKNPQIQTPATEQGAQRYATLKKDTAKLPKHLQDKFQGIRQEQVRYRPVDTPEFLDTPHVELLLLAVGMQTKEELAEALHELENEASEEIKTEIDPEDRPEDHARKKLKLDEDIIPDDIAEFK